MDQLEQIIITLHEQGLDEEEIYQEIEKQGLLTGDTSHIIVQTLIRQKPHEKAGSFGRVIIRIWGAICLLIGLGLLGLIIYLYVNGHSVSYYLFLVTPIMLFAGFKLFFRPDTAFNCYDDFD